jgi:hypothetical protein
MLDLFVKFDALIAHRTPFELRTGATLIGCLTFKTIEWENCSRDLEQFKSVRCGLCSGVLTGAASKRNVGTKAVFQLSMDVPQKGAFEAVSLTGGSHCFRLKAKETAPALGDAETVVVCRVRQGKPSNPFQTQ